MNSETDFAEDMEEVKKEMDIRRHATAARGRTDLCEAGHADVSAVYVQYVL